MKTTDLSHLSALAGRLDMISEASELLRGSKNIELPGIREETEQKNGITVHTVTVLNDETGRCIGKRKGHYVTFQLPPAADREVMADAAELAGAELRRMLPDLTDRLLLVAGLGNRNATADSLGPRTVEHTYPTRPLFRSNPPEGLNRVSAVTPGVMAMSGMESAEFLRGLCHELHPAALVVIDSLAAASITRVGTTIQMTDSGISPGGGIGNRRAAIDRSVCGCPVIAIGVPTVVDTAAIINETVASVRSFWQEKGIAMPLLDDASCEFTERRLLDIFQGRLMVTPQDIDDLIREDAELLAAAIAIAAHPGANRDNYEDFIR